MSDTSKISARSGDNDDDVKSLFDTFYDATESPSPEQEPAITSLKTLQADFRSILTDIQSLANNTRKRLLDRAETAVGAARVAHQTSTNVVAYILGKHRALEMLQETGNNHRCGTDHDTNTSSFDQARPAAEHRHSSSNIDDVKCNHVSHILVTEKHHTNALFQDIDLSVQIHDALLDEKKPSEVLLAVKDRVEVVWHRWEAKMKRDGIAELDKKYDDIRSEYAKLEDEAAMVAISLAVKRCDAREWKIMAYEEDWHGIFDEDLDKE